MGAAFVIAGFVGFVGGAFAIIFWVLAALCFALALEFYPREKAQMGQSPNGRNSGSAQSK